MRNWSYRIDRAEIAKINAEAAQEYLRLQNRLRAEPDPDVVWTPDDCRFLRSLRISPA